MTDSATQNSRLVLMGTGTSVGVPMLTCTCAVCTSEHPRNKRLRSGVLVRAPEGNFTIDASPDLRTQLLRERIDALHATMFTHSHADHIYGLDELRVFGHRLNADFPLYCEEPVENALRTAFPYAFDDSPAAHKWGKPRFELRRLEVRSFSLLGLEVTPIRLMHGKLPLLGFRLGSVAFCTDVSHIPEESWSLLEGVETLIITALRHEPHPTHFSVDEALAVVERLSPSQTYLTHCSHDLDYESTNAALPDGVELAYDGLSIDFSSSTVEP